MGIFARLLQYINICSRAELRVVSIYPCFNSCNLSTKRSKSIEDGESRSYSLACARAFCSVVSDL